MNAHATADLNLYRIDVDREEWTITLLSRGLTRATGVKLALQDTLKRLSDDLRGTGGEHFLESLQDALDQEEFERGWNHLRADGQHFGMRYVLQPTE